MKKDEGLSVSAPLCVLRQHMWTTTFSIWTKMSCWPKRCILLRVQRRARNRRVKPSLGWRRKSTRWQGLLNRWRPGEDADVTAFMNNHHSQPIVHRACANLLFSCFSPCFHFSWSWFFFFFLIKIIWTVRNIWWSRPETWTRQQGSCCSCSSSPHLPDI